MRYSEQRHPSDGKLMPDSLSSLLATPKDDGATAIWHSNWRHIPVNNNMCFGGVHRYFLSPCSSTLQRIWMQYAVFMSNDRPLWQPGCEVAGASGSLQRCRSWRRAGTWLMGWIQKWRQLIRLSGDGEGVLDKDVWSGRGLGSGRGWWQINEAIAGWGDEEGRRGFASKLPRDLYLPSPYPWTAARRMGSGSLPPNPPPHPSSQLLIQLLWDLRSSCSMFAALCFHRAALFERRDSPPGVHRRTTQKPFTCRRPAKSLPLGICCGVLAEVSVILSILWLGIVNNAQTAMLW